MSIDNVANTRCTTIEGSTIAKTTMSTIYVHLTPHQKGEIKSAVEKRKGVTLRVDPSKPGPHPIPVTKQLAAKILREGAKKHVDVHLSHEKLKRLGKSGGFAWLLPLLASAATAAIGSFAAHGAKKGAEKVFGKGLIQPGKKGSR